MVTVQVLQVLPIMNWREEVTDVFSRSGFTSFMNGLSCAFNTAAENNKRRERMILFITEFKRFSKPRRMLKILSPVLTERKRLINVMSA
jgi:replication-associated recombination protein RarA